MVMEGYASPPYSTSFRPLRCTIFLAASPEWVRFGRRAFRPSWKKLLRYRTPIVCLRQAVEPVVGRRIIAATEVAQKPAATPGDRDLRLGPEPAATFPSKWRGSLITYLPKGRTKSYN
jgi:hypothetical protein